MQVMLYSGGTHTHTQHFWSLHRIERVVELFLFELRRNHCKLTWCSRTEKTDLGDDEALGAVLLYQ